MTTPLYLSLSSLSSNVQPEEEMPEDGNRVPKTGIAIGTKLKMQKRGVRKQSDMEGRYLHFPVEF
jgi:hypothetical protein